MVFSKEYIRPYRRRSPNDATPVGPMGVQEAYLAPELFYYASQWYAKRQELNASHKMVLRKMRIPS